MSIPASPLKLDVLSHVGVPDPMPVLGQAEATFKRTGQHDPDARRPQQARRIATACMRAWRLREHMDDAVLLVSELVTNAFQHSTGEVVRVRFYLTEKYVCIEVQSDCAATPQPKSAGETDESGRGLFLVDAVADAWGAAQDGTMVWCILRHNLSDLDNAS